jgi:energy-coupling factor transporter transmembrane protein EcfT
MIVVVIVVVVMSIIVVVVMIIIVVVVMIIIVVVVMIIVVVVAMIIVVVVMIIIVVVIMTIVVVVPRGTHDVPPVTPLCYVGHPELPGGAAPAAAGGATERAAIAARLDALDASVAGLRARVAAAEAQLQQGAHAQLPAGQVRHRSGMVLVIARGQGSHAAMCAQLSYLATAPTLLASMATISIRASPSSPPWAVLKIIEKIRAQLHLAVYFQHSSGVPVQPGLFGLTASPTSTVPSADQRRVALTWTEDVKHRGCHLSVLPAKQLPLTTAGQTARFLARLFKLPLYETGCGVSALTATKIDALIDLADTIAAAASAKELFNALSALNAGLAGGAAAGGLAAPTLADLCLWGAVKAAGADAQHVLAKLPAAAAWFARCEQQYSA